MLISALASFGVSWYRRIINLQPRGGQAKPYQVRQVRSLIAKYALTLRDEE
jgi:hypothetical protein